jgi:uncharacterized protein (TIGR03083 family)
VSRPRTDTYDAIVVGARCAGATVATLLARAGRRVLVVDRDVFPSDTVSTHQLFPDSLQLLDELGAGERLRAAHRLHPTQYSWRVLGHAVAGGFIPAGGHDRTLSVRRVALDKVLVDTAAAAGAELRLGATVDGLLGAGTEDDPVRGVLLRNGERIHASWVVGADGRTSTVARRLGLAKRRQLRGEMAMLLGYWRGLPPSDWCQIDVHERWGLMSSPCEDDLHLLSVAGPPEITRGNPGRRQETYGAALRRFPAVLNPRLLQEAEQVTTVVAVPETMLRGFERQAAGPGWALVGDSGLFKHPVTAQGMGDALAQGRYVGSALARGDGLDRYADWRAERSAGHYEWSFEAARFPTQRAAAVYSGLAADNEASREFREIFTRRHRPDEVFTAERTRRWQTAWTYKEGLHELRHLLEGISDLQLIAPVPACPEWNVGELVAHLVGVAADSARGAYFAAALDAWQDPAVAKARDEWTAGHLDLHTSRTREALLRDIDLHGNRLVMLTRRGQDTTGDGSRWLALAPLGDLSVHLGDLREALGLPPDETGPVARSGFALYRDWLHDRLRQCGMPALRLVDGHREWVVGDGEAGATVTATGYELFRMISGRRSAGQISAFRWTGDPAPYLPMISPYPLPA